VVFRSFSLCSLSVHLEVAKQFYSPRRTKFFILPAQQNMNPTPIAHDELRKMLNRKSNCEVSFLVRQVGQLEWQSFSGKVVIDCNGATAISIPNQSLILVPQQGYEFANLQVTKQGSQSRATTPSGEEATGDIANLLASAAAERHSHTSAIIAQAQSAEDRAAADRNQHTSHIISATQSAEARATADRSNNTAAILSGQQNIQQHLRQSSAEQQAAAQENTRQILKQQTATENMLFHALEAQSKEQAHQQRQMRAVLEQQQKVLANLQASIEASLRASSASPAPRVPDGSQQAPFPVSSPQFHSVSSTTSTVLEATLLRTAEEADPVFSSHRILSATRDIFSEAEIRTLSSLPEYLLCKKEQNFAEHKRAILWLVRWVIDNFTNQGKPDKPKIMRWFRGNLDRDSNALSTAHFAELLLCLDDNGANPRAVARLAELAMGTDKQFFAYAPRMLIARLASPPLSAAEVTEWLKGSTKHIPPRGDLASGSGLPAFREGGF